MSAWAISPTGSNSTAISCFAPNRDWRSFDIKILMRGLSLDLQSAATNQTLQLVFTSEGLSLRRTFTFAELRDPGQILRSFTGDLAGGPAGALLGLETAGPHRRRQPPVARLAHRLRVGHDSFPSTGWKPACSIIPSPSLSAPSAKSCA